MFYDDVYNKDELNQKVTEYVAMGYKVKNRTFNYVKLVKDDFSWVILVILILFLFPIGIIYYFVKNGNKEEIIIRVKDVAPANVSSNAVKYCVKCGGAIASEESKFCPECGIEIN